MLLDELARLSTPRIEANKDIPYYPFVVSPCINGIRVYIEDGVAYRANGSPIKNQFIQSQLLQLGEHPGVFEGVINIAYQNSTKNVRDMVNTQTSLNEVKFIFHIHDYYLTKEEPYSARLERILITVKDIKSDHIAFMPQKLIYSEPQLVKYEKVIKSAGYDGVIIRKLDGLYPIKGSSSDEQIIVYKPLSI